MRQTTPVTRLVVFYIVSALMGVLLMIIFAFAISIFERAAKAAERTIDILEMMTDRFKQLEGRDE
jgi:hypothetical protein